MAIEYKRAGADVDAGEPLVDWPAMLRTLDCGVGTTRVCEVVAQDGEPDWIINDARGFEA